MKTGKALMGVVAGMAAGAVIGMIFAPEKKSNKRLSLEKDIKEALDKKIEEKFDELILLMSKKQERI